MKVEVLSRGPLVFVDLADLHHMITYDHLSGEYETESSEVVSRARMRELLSAQRSAPDFFDELDPEEGEEDDEDMGVDTEATEGDRGF